MDYIKLRDLLKAGNWKDADEETRRVILAVTKREQVCYLDTKSIDTFPCEDLRTIDQLWVKYSNDKFGFSVQKRIYQSLGGTRNYNYDIWCKFGDKVGWRKWGNKWLYYRDITFDIKAPEGHLPLGMDNGILGDNGDNGIFGFSGLGGWVVFLGWGVGVVVLAGLFSRVETCRLFPVQERQAEIIPTPQPVNEEVQLKSSCGMDYSKLRDLLKAGKWKEVDEETYRVMLAVAKREKEGWLRVEDIDNFPCPDLRTIDQLWVKYSNGKFGFSVQKLIYQDYGGTREYNREIWEKFGDEVGWRKGGKWLYYNDVTFDIKAREGHLPYRSGVSDFRIGWFGFGCVSSLASRLVKCNI
jgi:hypothetical protein